MTAGFLWVWYWDPTLLTFIALMGLVLTLVDYVGPKIINQVSGKIFILHVEKNALLMLSVTGVWQQHLDWSKRTEIRPSMWRDSWSHRECRGSFQVVSANGLLG